ncbi:P-type conjugative transfer protein TrbL [Duganella sp. BuS-21]|uniref:P-type conjugative transfer protein TrbL n=1 Tax=Duganella sp. BuS-21 TaxID=2943848 RepID=UPI0035A6821B
MDRQVYTNTKYLVFLALLLISLTANAEIETDEIFDKVHDVYFAAATSWATVIKLHATRLFWTLALISLVWTFGMMALRNADTGEFFAEFIRFTIFTGFYWWLLDNGPAIAEAIVNSMRNIGASASAGTHPAVYPLPSPSSIVDVGFAILGQALVSASVWSPFASVLGAFLALAILIILTLIAINVLIVLISAWVLAYAGIFFLGFGGCRWTSDMAINYFKTVLGVGVQLLVMVLLVGVGKNFVDVYYSHMSAGMLITEMCAFTVVVLVMLALINKLPPLLAGLVTGGGTGALGGGLGARDAIAAAAMASAALSTAGAALTSAATNVAGGVQALMAAMSKGTEGSSQSGSIDRDFMASPGADSQAGGNGESPLAQAMGNDTSQNSSGTSDKKSDGTSDNSSGSGQKSASGKSSTGTSSTTSTAKVSSRQSASSSSGGAKAARGAAGNLASGIAQVAKNSFSARVANTFGGKVAQAIRESGSAAKASESANTLSAGTKADFDPQAEVASFRDRDQDDDSHDP